MKFGTIKVGDTVIIREGVREGFDNPKYFWVPAKVKRVTPKQFTVGSKRYNKKDGAMIGGSCSDNAHYFGQNVDGKEIVDESAEMKAYISSIRLNRLMAGKLEKIAKIKAYHPKLADICELVWKAEKLI